MFSQYVYCLRKAGSGEVTIRAHRISAGAIVIQDDKILLVRYNDKHNSNYLVGPGGGVYSDDESITQALRREVKEETGLEVNPFKLLFVEDLLSSQNRHAKIWFLCDVVGGLVEKTQGALDEGIIEARWYQRDELTNEVVYPPVLLDESWQSFFTDTFEGRYLGLRTADF
jgi:ADP-ribose pyrophosphatase YjhB (NUDIX family)